MANFYKNFTSDTLMSFGKSFARLNGQPLDKSAIWYSLEEAQAYAATGAAYVGQPVAVIDETNLKTTLYVVGANSTLEPVGIIPNGDSKTIEVSAAGAISILGAATAADGTLPMLENGALVWKSLEQIGAGDGNDNTTYEFSLLEKGEGDAAEAYGIKVQVKENGVATGDPIELALDVYTKSEIDATVGGLENRIKTLEDAEDKDTTYSVKEGDKVLALDGTEFSTTIGLKHENGMISLTGIGGEVIAEFSDADFVKDSVLEDVNYNAETKEIEFTWKTVDDETKTDAVSVADFVQTYTAGNGLELTGNEFAIKVDADSEAFLVVGETGLKLAGVQDAIDAAKGAALTEVANNYYNKTEVYNKEEVYSKTEVYNKNEVYTKGEADKAIADKITEVNGGESAGEVLGQLTAYQKIVNMEVWGNEDATGDSRIDALDAEVLTLKNAGYQANVIETVKVNGAALVVSEKAVDIAVPTMLSQLDGYTGIDERITAAQNTANTAQTTANEVKGTAAANAAAIEALTGRVTPLEEAKSNHESRIKTLEDANTQHAGDYATLAGTVAAHTEAINKKAEQSALNAVADLAAANEQAIKTLTETTIPGLEEEIGKKANADAVYTKEEAYSKEEVDALENTLLQAIADAKDEASYDDTEVKGLISAEETRALAAEAALAERVGTVEDFFKAVETPDEVIDTLAEIVHYIENDKSGAAGMLASIEQNTEAIAAINNETDGILAKAKKYTDDSIAALPFATADVAGLVKSSTGDNKVTVEDDGTMTIKQMRVSVDDLYVPEDEDFIIGGGGAAGFN